MRIPKDFSLKKIKKDQLLIIFLAGILLLVISLPAGKKSGRYGEENGIRGSTPKEEYSQDECITWSGVWNAPCPRWRGWGM